MSAERLPDFRERVSDAPQGVSREIDGQQPGNDSIGSIFHDGILRLAGGFHGPVELFPASFSEHFVPLERREKVNPAIDPLDLRYDFRRIRSRFTAGGGERGVANEPGSSGAAPPGGDFDPFPFGIGEADGPRRARPALFVFRVGIVSGRFLIDSTHRFLSSMRMVRTVNR